MKIEANKVVSFHYTLSEVGGEQLEASDRGHPMTYLVGHGNVLAGLERAMLGRQVGDKFEVTLSPAEGYGARKDNAEQRIAIKHVVTPGKKNRTYAWVRR